MVFKFKSVPTHWEFWTFRSPIAKSTDENVEKVREVIHEDRRRTVNDVRNSFGRTYDTDWCSFTEDLNMWQTAAKFVPCLLNDDMT